MSGDLPSTAPSMIERIDLALATRLAAARLEQEPIAGSDRFHAGLRRLPGGDAAWIGGLLRLRGLVVFDDDIAEALAGRGTRLARESQEHQMALGLADALRAMRDRAAGGEPPDGHFLMDLFQAMTRGVARFRGNLLRADAPWDAVLYVVYPKPDELRRILDSFHRANCYRDLPQYFETLHPVRQAFRVLWRLARVAPFPDFNQVMAWVAMCSYLMSRGYPAITPDASDRTLLQNLMTGPPPMRVVQWEARVLAAAEGRP